MSGDRGVWLSCGGLSGVHKALGSAIPTYSWPLCGTVSAVGGTQRESSFSLMGRSTQGKSEP